MMSSKRNATVSVCRLLAAAACAVAPMLAVGCADEPSMLVITGAVEPEVGDTCLASPDAETLRAYGLLDVAVASNYLLPLRVENVAPTSGSVGTTQPGGGGGQQGGGFDNLDLEGNAIFVTKAAVEYDVKEGIGGVDLGGFDVPIGGPMVTPGGGAAAFFVPVLTEFQVAQMRQVVAPGDSALIITKVTIAGQTTSETEVETNTFNFPITVCNGCLGRPQCTASEATDLESSGCFPGQNHQYCLTIVPDETTTP